VPELRPELLAGSEQMHLCGVGPEHWGCHGGEEKDEGNHDEHLED
jgi:hypothetical protein